MVMLRNKIVREVDRRQTSGRSKISARLLLQNKAWMPSEELAGRARDIIMT
jgi:hypothetical protein